MRGGDWTSQEKWNLEETKAILRVGDAPDTCIGHREDLHPLTKIRMLCNKTQRTGSKFLHQGTIPTCGSMPGHMVRAENRHFKS